jgi:membrane protein required for colicin V production
MENGSIAVLDIVVSLPLLWAAWQGFRRGFVTQVAIFLGLGMGLFAGYYGSARVAAWLHSEWHWTGNWVNPTAFFFAFVGVLLLVRILAKVVEKGAKLAMLNWVNRLLGVLFATLSGVLLLSVLFYFFNHIAGWREWLPEGAADHARLYPKVEGCTGALIPDMAQWPDSLNLDRIPDALTQPDTAAAGPQP